MKLIKPSFKIISQGYTLKDVYKQIELCGRTCYKSTDKITDDSAKPFVDRMIASKHFAMLEHGTVYLKYTLEDTDIWHPKQAILRNQYSRYEEDYDTDAVFVTTNLRVIVENGWESLLQYICKPTGSHYKRYTVKFICNRQVSHEFVRHKLLCVA